MYSSTDPCGDKARRSKEWAENLWLLFFVFLIVCGIIGAFQPEGRSQPRRYGPEQDREILKDFQGIERDYIGGIY